ncbi:hypothetical protein FZG76_13270 [Salmonella enterica]|nr:hypothetical protein [Salmonella enterica]
MFLGNGIVEFTPETGTECRPFTILKRYLYQIIKFYFYLCYCNNKLHVSFCYQRTLTNFNGGLDKS